MRVRKKRNLLSYKLCKNNLCYRVIDFSDFVINFTTQKSVYGKREKEKYIIVNSIHSSES